MAYVAKQLAKRPTQDYDEDEVDPKLFEEIGRIMASNPDTQGGEDYSKLMELLNIPLPKIQANLRYHRARIGMALLPRVQRHLLEFTGRYFVMHDQVATELERRLSDPDYMMAMKHKDLLDTARTIATRMDIIDKYVGVAPPPEKIIEQVHPETTAASVTELILAMQAIKSKQELAIPVAEDAEFEDDVSPP